VLAAFARARPCYTGLRASLCCPAWQLVVVVAVSRLLNKHSIIIIIITIFSSAAETCIGCCLFWQFCRQLPKHFPRDINTTIGDTRQRALTV